MIKGMRVTGTGLLEMRVGNVITEGGVTVATLESALGPKQLEWCRSNLTLNGQPIFAMYEKQAQDSKRRNGHAR